MQPLEKLIDDITARCDVFSWGNCPKHPLGDNSCIECAIDHVCVWDAPLAVLIAAVAFEEDNDNFAILHDYLNDKGLDHHEEQIMRDVGKWIQWECQPWRVYG